MLQQKQKTFISIFIEQINIFNKSSYLQFIEETNQQINIFNKSSYLQFIEETNQHIYNSTKIISSPAFVTFSKASSNGNSSSKHSDVKDNQKSAWSIISPTAFHKSCRLCTSTIHADTNGA